MRYTYDVYDKNGTRVDTSLSSESAWSIVKDLQGGWRVQVSDNLRTSRVVQLWSQDDFEGWDETLARGIWREDDKQLSLLLFGPPKEDSKEPSYEQAQLRRHLEEVKSGLKMGTFSDEVEMPVRDNINPPHYKGYVGDMQWIDTMSRIPSFREPSTFEAALELQVRKYLDRRGQKDNGLQELMKARFYLTYMIAYIENGRLPIRVENVVGLELKSVLK